MSDLDRLFRCLETLKRQQDLPKNLSLHKRMFKIPNKDGFYFIYCYLMSFIPEMGKFTFTKGMNETMERRLRSSIKESILKINETYPYANLKPIPESNLVAPKGPKVEDFLLNLAAFVVKYICTTKYAFPMDLVSLATTKEPQSQEFSLKKAELDLSLEKQSNENIQKKEKLESEISKLTAEHELLRRSLKEKKELVLNTIDSHPFMEEEVKIRLKSELPSNAALLEWASKLDEELALCQKTLSIEEQCENMLSRILSLADFIRNDSGTLDGNDVFASFGSKAITTYAKKHNIELFRDGQLSLLGAIQVAMKGYENVIEQVPSKLTPYLESHKVVSSLAEELDSRIKKKSEMLIECTEMEKKYEKLVNESADDCIGENVFSKLFEVNHLVLPEGTEKKTNPKSFASFPESFALSIREDNVLLRTSIVKSQASDIGNASVETPKCVYNGTTANGTTNSTISPKKLMLVKTSLGLVPSKKRTMLAFPSFMKSRPQKSTGSKGTPIKSEDRRATLASPVPTRERRKMKSKSLFPPAERKVFTSSPANSISNANMESLKEISLISPAKSVDHDCQFDILQDMIIDDLTSPCNDRNQALQLRRRSLSEDRQMIRRRSVNTLISDYREFKKTLSIYSSSLNCPPSTSNELEEGSDFEFGEFSIPETLDDTDF